jgi:signal transduction histidine kinase
MLQRDGEPALSGRQRHMVDEAEKSCARLVAIVGELSDIAKLDAGSLALARQPIDLFALVDEAASRVESIADRDVHLAVRGDSTGARISGDSGRLAKALEAIFRAIVREHAGPATVVAERRFDTVNGVRRAVVIVSEESRVQAAYAAQPGEFDEKRGGLGLALPLARRVVEGHGGQLWSPRSAVDGDALARGAILVAVPVS